MAYVIRFKAELTSGTICEQLPKAPDQSPRGQSASLDKGRGAAWQVLDNNPGDFHFHYRLLCFQVSCPPSTF